MSKPPPRIFLQWFGENYADHEGPPDTTTWCEDKINDDDVEYVRKDRIEKVFKQLADVYEKATKICKDAGA